MSEGVPLVSERGEPCAGADDEEECEQNIEERFNDYPILVAHRSQTFELTHGEEIVAEILPVDTLDEAMLVAYLGGYLPPRCGVDSADGGREVEDGYEIVLIGDIECRATGRGGEQKETFYRHLLHVDEEGAITELGREADSRTYCEDFCECREVPQ